MKSRTKRFVAGLRRDEPEARQDRRERRPHAGSRDIGRGGEGLRGFSGAKKGGSTITAPAISSPKSRASPIATRPPNEWPTTTGGPPRTRRPLAPASRASRTNCAEVVSGAPVRTAHAGEGSGDDAALAGEERRDERPPVGVGRPAMQEDQARPAALPPGERFDPRALDLDEGSLGLARDRALEPRRRRRLLPAKGRERRHEGRFVQADAPTGFTRLRTGPPRPCRRRRTSSRRRISRRAACLRSARGRSCARPTCRRGGRSRSRRRRR